MVSNEPCDSQLGEISQILNIRTDDNDGQQHQQNTIGGAPWGPLPEDTIRGAPRGLPPEDTIRGAP